MRRYVVFLNLLVLAEAWFAWRDGYLLMSQVRYSVPEGMKVAVFAEHAGMWGDFFIVSPIVAYILSVYGARWEIRQLLTTFGCAAVTGLALAITWTEANHHLYESMARGGYVTVTGVIHMVYMVISLTAIAMYYGTRGVSRRSAYAITALLTFHVGLGVLLPSWVTYGAIFPSAWAVALILWAILAIVALITIKRGA